MIALGIAFWAGTTVGAVTGFWATVWLLSLERERSTSGEADRWLRAHRKRVRR